MKRVWNLWKDFCDEKTIFDLVFLIGGFMLSLLAFVAVLLHPYYLLHVILCLLSILCMVLVAVLIRTRKKTIELDRLFNGDIPLISTFSYLMNSRKREKATQQSTIHRPYNDIPIDEATITYFFDEAFDVINKRRRFCINVIWHFVGIDHRHDNHRMYLLVSNSLLEKNTKTRFEVKKRDFENYKIKVEVGKRIHSLQRYILLDFTGNGLQRNRKFSFDVIMGWDETYRVDSKDYYIIDPMNYSNNIRTITVKIVIKTQHSTPFFKVSLQAHRRDTFSVVRRNWPIILECHRNKRGELQYDYSFIPNNKFIYMLEFKRKRCDDYEYKRKDRG